MRRLFGSPGLLITTLAIVVMVWVGCAGEPAAESSVSSQSGSIESQSEEQALLQTIRELIAFVEAGEIVIEMQSSGPDVPDGTGLDPLQELQGFQDMLTDGDLWIFLQTEAEPDVERIRTEIETWPEMEGYDFVSSEEELERVRQDLGEEAAYVLDGLSMNPFPASFEVRLRAGTSSEEVAKRISGDPAVEEIKHGPLSLDLTAELVSFLLANSTATTPKAEQWLDEHREVLAGDDSADSADTDADRDYVTVIHPFHNQWYDAPLYTHPTAIEVVPELESRLSELPDVVPAGKLRVVPPPAEADLDLSRNRQGELAGWSWMDADLLYAEDPTGSAPLGNKDEALETARTFLEDHGLAPALAEAGGFDEPNVTVGSSVQVGNEPARPTSWIVRFPAGTQGLEEESSVSVRVAPEGQVSQVTWRLLEVDSPSNEFIRLRPAEEVIQDLEAWYQGYASREIRELMTVELLVKNVSLAFESVENVPDEASRYRVPVYVFTVEVTSPERHRGATGTWRVVAAQDVKR